ncbi:MAG: ATPase, T2SS/T4P/T4SS family [Candidatus Aenigmatarchaeota archaeon]
MTENNDIIPIPEYFEENETTKKTSSETPIEKQEKPIIQMPKTQEESIKNNVRLWFKKIGWSENPFTFNILPSLFVGYKEQIIRALMAIDEKHKIIFISGPTGSGKTTFLKWISNNINAKKFEIFYIPKPPKSANEFVDLFNNRFKSGILRFFLPNIKNIYQIPNFIERKIKNRHLIIMIDEVHESDIEILEWLRVLCDQVNNISIIISGLPIFEDKIRDKLETFRKRISVRIELLSLTKEETIELIRKRIQNVGGNGNEFDDVIDFIYTKTAGFPREVLRICDEILNKAISQGTIEITKDLLEEEAKGEMVSTTILNEMTPMQREIIELLAKGPQTPGQIADSINLEKYKSRQHAVRSVNNIMKKLYEDGFIERRKVDKAFVYSLSGRLKTIVVKA